MAHNATATLPRPKRARKGSDMAHNTTATLPFRVFVSHKIAGHGRVVEQIKHDLESYGGKMLKLFVSPALKPGVQWKPKVFEEIEEADLFLLLYLVEGQEMDWCLYEAGYFEREARRTGKKLICMVSPGRDLPGPLVDRQKLEATPEGVEKLLRALYADEKKPVRPDFFDRDNDKTLRTLADTILGCLDPFKTEPLCPRLWIELSGQDALSQLRNCTLPGTARLSGEAEALRQLGLKAGDEITVDEFSRRSEFDLVLKLYAPHLANCMRRVIERYPELWVVPPVTLSRGVPPKVLVPASFEKGLNDSYRFEFLIYQAEPDVQQRVDSSFNLLCHLFVVASTFRRRIIEDWREQFLNLQSLGSAANPDNVRRQVRKFSLVFGATLLEALSHKMDSPRRVQSCFEDEEDRQRIQDLLGTENGLYTKCHIRLQACVDKCDIGGIVECLDQLKEINRSILAMITARLHGLLLEAPGKRVGEA